MKLDAKVKRLVDTNSFQSVLYSLLRILPLEKLILAFSNQCIFLANSEKTNKRIKSWYRLARVFHRAYDEMILEKQKRNVFKIIRRDYCLCPKCKKKFRIDPAKQENCKFELDIGAIVITCPHCGKKE